MELVLKERDEVSINGKIFSGTEFIIDPERCKLCVDGIWKDDDFFGDLDIHILGSVRSLDGLRKCEHVKW